MFVVVHPTVFDRLDPAAQARVISHEATHVASADATGDGTPHWLVEGLAEYVSRRSDPQPLPLAAPELTAEVRAGRLPAALPADSAFDPGSPDVLAAYQQAWLAVRLIAQRAGAAGPLRFYTDVGESPLAPDAAVAGGCAGVLHESTAAFTAQWRAALRAELAA